MTLIGIIQRVQTSIEEMGEYDVESAGPAIAEIKHSWSMLTRFLRSFLLIALALILILSFFIIQPSSRAYVDPFTGELFAEGGTEADPAKAQDVDPEGLRGGVIMSKLGNETAK